MKFVSGAIVEKQLSDGRWVGVTALLWGRYVLWIEENEAMLKTGVRDGGFDRGYEYPDRASAAHAFDSYQWYSDKPETGWIRER